MPAKKKRSHSQLSTSTSEPEPTSGAASQKVKKTIAVVKKPNVYTVDAFLALLEHVHGLCTGDMHKYGLLFHDKQGIHSIIVGYATYGQYQDLAALAPTSELALAEITRGVAELKTITKDRNEAACFSQLRDAAVCLFQLHRDFNIPDTSIDSFNAMVTGLDYWVRTKGSDLDHDAHVACISYLPAGLYRSVLSENSFHEISKTCESSYVETFFKLGDAVEFDLWIDEIRNSPTRVELFDSTWRRVIDFIINQPVEVSRIGCYWMLFDHVDEMNKWTVELRELACNVANLWITHHRECSNALLTTVIPSSVLSPYRNIDIEKVFTTPLQLTGRKQNRIVITDAHVLMTSPGGLKRNRMISPWEHFGWEGFTPVCGMHAFEFTGNSLRILNGRFVDWCGIGFDNMCVTTEARAAVKSSSSSAMSDK